MNPPKNDQNAKIVWRETKRCLPIDFGLVLTINVLPVLVFWKVPAARTWLCYLLWAIGSSAFVLAGTASVGPVLSDRTLGDFWTPWRMVIVFVFHLMVMGGVIVALGA